MTGTDGLAEIMRAYDTPAYVFDADAFRTRIRDVRKALGDETGLCFSMKANPFLAAVAADEGLLVETCSPGELDICIACGIAPRQILYSGVCKGEEDVRRALEYGVGTFTAESPRQLTLVDAEAESMGKVADVLLRLAAGSQFGMTFDDLAACVDSRDSMCGVSLVGIHYFVGTQRSHAREQRKDLSIVAEAVARLRDEHGWDPSRIEYGPGLPVPYFDGDDFSDTLAPARELAPALSSMSTGHALTVEMGRFLAAGCGCYVSRIVETKDGEGDPYAFVEGGINHVSYYGHMMGMKRPVIRNITAVIDGDAEGRDRGPWNLCGSLCTTSDVLARRLSLPLRVGDALSLENAGAYSVTEGIGLFLSRDLPKVIMIDRGKATLLRDAMPTSSINMPGPRS